MKLKFTQKDHRAAQKEGWDLFETERGDDIQKDDDKGVFPYDADACHFVVKKALTGSKLHIKALVLHLKLIQED